MIKTEAEERKSRRSVSNQERLLGKEETETWKGKSGGEGGEERIEARGFPPERRGRGKEMKFKRAHAASEGRD